jgi:ribosomal protein S18 acetylase RimI-like enzyme
MTATIDIITVEPRYAADFKQLNLEWLERLFRVEPIDVEVLSRPEDIVRAGGAIWLARQGNAVIGCCALIAKGDGAYEVSKMAVTSNAQGQGVGRRLLDVAVQGFSRTGGSLLFLETNSALKTAIALYESSGFKHRPRPEPSPYERADVYMVHTG